MFLDIKTWRVENFDDLPSFRYFPTSCRYCAHWESLGFNNKGKKENAEKIKKNWLISVRKNFGNCGFIAYWNNRPVAFAQYAPVKHIPSISKYPEFTPSQDTIFLACLYVPDKELRGKGIGKQLIEKIELDLKNRGYRSIETYSQITPTSSEDISDWLIWPIHFFLNLNFQILHQKNNITHLRKKL